MFRATQKFRGFQLSLVAAKDLNRIDRQKFRYARERGFWYPKSYQNLLPLYIKF